MNFDQKEQKKIDGKIIKQIKQIIQRESKKMPAEKKVMAEAGNLLIRAWRGDYEALDKLITIIEE